MFDRCVHVFGRLHMGVASVLLVAFMSPSPEIPVRDEFRVQAQSYAFHLTATIDTSSSTVGIADSGLYFMTEAELTRAMEELQALGVTQIRVFLPWRAMEPSEETYEWTQADQLLDMAESYGIAVVASVTSTPTWASDYGGVVANGEPTSSTAYADFVAALADRYGTAANDGEAKIAAYEIWNEPNGFTGWYPEPDAEQYTELLKAAYTAIKAVDPAATVIGGVLGAGISIGTLTVNPVTFLTEMYEAGAAGYFDALSFHPYNYTSTLSAGTTFANSAIKQLTELRELMNANGDAEKLIWVTEYGQPSTQVSEENQAAYIADFLATWAELTGVGPAFLYSLIDTATGSSTAEDNLGLFTDDWTPKAVVEVIKAWIAGETTPVDPGEVDSGSVADIITALVRAAQSFVVSIAAMVTSALDGVTEFVRGVVDAVIGLAGALNPAAGSSTATTRSVTMTVDTGTGDDTSAVPVAERENGIVHGTAVFDGESTVSGETAPTAEADVSTEANVSIDAAVTAESAESTAEVTEVTEMTDVTEVTEMTEQATAPDEEPNAAAEPAVTGETTDMPAATDTEEAAVAPPHTRKVGPRPIQRTRDHAVRQRISGVANGRNAGNSADSGTPTDRTPASRSAGPAD
ncbi:MAG: cellulase family glycosylhydrolase [Mycobacterium sp.]